MKKKIRSWEDLEERFRLVDQLCRAAASIPANIVEGKTRDSLKEYLRFLSVARGSAEETRYWLLLARDLGYIDVSVHDDLSGAYIVVTKMINGLHAQTV